MASDVMLTRLSAAMRCNKAGEFTAGAVNGTHKPPARRLTRLGWSVDNCAGASCAVTTICACRSARVSNAEQFQLGGGFVRQLTEVFNHQEMGLAKFGASGAGGLILDRIGITTGEIRGRHADTLSCGRQRRPLMSQTQCECDLPVPGGPYKTSGLYTAAISNVSVSPSGKGNSAGDSSSSCTATAAILFSGPVTKARDAASPRAFAGRPSSPKVAAVKETVKAGCSKSGSIQPIGERSARKKGRENDAGL